MQREWDRWQSHDAEWDRVIAEAVWMAQIATVRSPGRLKACEAALSRVIINTAHA